MQVVVICLCFHPSHAPAPSATTTHPLSLSHLIFRPSDASICPHLFSAPPVGPCSTASPSPLITPCQLIQSFVFLCWCPLTAVNPPGVSSYILSSFVYLLTYRPYIFLSSVPRHAPLPFLASHLTVFCHFLYPHCNSSGGMVRPVRMIAPALEELAGEYDGRLTVARSIATKTAKSRAVWGARDPKLISSSTARWRRPKVGALPKTKITEWIDASI